MKSVKEATEIKENWRKAMSYLYQLLRIYFVVIYFYLFPFLSIILNFLA